tara:strand:- start:2333 stop:2833 length:501 start_codon:yes stop_codon:yes gene_type:complete
MSKNLNLILEYCNKLKELAPLEGLDPDQVSGLYGEAQAKKIILEKIDKGYKPAPPRQDNIDGTGDLGTYSVKYLTPKMDVVSSAERNLIQLHSDLNFDFLTVICDTGEVFNIPRDKIVNNNEFNIFERRKTKMINWMTNGLKKKCSIRPTNDNWNTLINNYLVCKL